MEELTNKELATELYETQVALSCTDDLLHKLCKRLGISVLDLSEETENDEKARVLGAHHHYKLEARLRRVS